MKVHGPASDSPLVLSLAIAAVVGISFVFLYPDSYQQDGPNHFLQARWAWAEPRIFVDVWARPLFTLVYAVPARLGYPVAKVFTVGVLVATAWQTSKLAAELGLARAPLAAPFLLAAPVVMLLLAETMTEPLFALLFVVSLRLYRQGHPTAAALAASMLILVRLEGAFLGLLWAVWLLRDGRPRLIPVLGAGLALWWAAALAITGDPRWIQHNWPPDWSIARALYGRGSPVDFVFALPVIAGPILLLPFAVGLICLLRDRRLGQVTSSFLVAFMANTALWVIGASAGYARVFVGVAPVTALITLEGWNRLGGRVGPRLRVPVAVTILVASGLLSFIYLDIQTGHRESWAVRDTAARLRAHRPSPAHMMWSRMYAAVLLDRPAIEFPGHIGDREKALARLHASAPGTVAFWDGYYGPTWYRLDPGDFEAAGFERLDVRTYQRDGWLGVGASTRTEIFLFIKRD